MKLQSVALGQSSAARCGALAAFVVSNLADPCILSGTYDTRVAHAP